MKNLAKAIIEVMKAVENIEKNTTVGSGSYSYKGVSDKDVKKAYNNAMTEQGLCILPLEVDSNITIERWEETNQYGTKQKKEVFTEVRTKYLLLHTSGESQVISGYGQGTDNQDKGAGKATTYALKYTLLYTFLTPTGDIDDSDSTHSEDSSRPTIKDKLSEKELSDLTNPNNKGQIQWFLDNREVTETQKKVLTKLQKTEPKKELRTLTFEEFNRAIAAVKKGTMKAVDMNDYDLDKGQKKLLTEALLLIDK
jgi:hypothetical protein